MTSCGVPDLSLVQFDSTTFQETEMIQLRVLGGSIIGIRKSFNGIFSTV